MNALTVCFVLAAALQLVAWQVARSAPNRRVNSLRRQAAIAKAEAERATRARDVATARATHAQDQRDAASRELTALLASCAELAGYWDAMAPAPGSYPRAARELRTVLAQYHNQRGAAL